MNKKDVLEAYISRVEFPNKGIIEIGDYKVTVKNALPGQKVRAVVNKKRKNRIEARLLEVLEKAPTEILGACEVFGLCGGCLYQSLPYDEQLKLKVEQVQNLLKPLGIVDRYEGIISSPEIYEYRNKMEYSFGNAYIDGPLALGLHKRGSMYDIVNATECKIIHDDFNKVVQATLDLFTELDLPFYHKRTHEGYLRYLVVRRGVRSSQLQINLVTSSQLEPNLQLYVDKLRALDLDHEIKGIIHTITDQLSDAVKVDDMRILYGEEHIDESLLGLNFKISPFSFFQTNTLGAEKLYEVVRDYVGETKDKVIFDLYSGTGTITQMLAPVAKKTVGVEIVKEAVEAAKVNAKLNGLSNCEFIAGDVLTVIDELTDKPDTIVLDPPRDGIHPKAMPKIIDFGVDNIVYVSCKPTSLARDLALLMDAGYEVVKWSMVDMFPHTIHVETIVRLYRSNH
ncbi:putative enzyme [Petrocella atlantisensis]|uniref:Putative enzyme n=1 Tax=Petrocella atlantisensis TaxID=2173034 RepID=A0A3P7PTK1_9FIRM|nr:23S rRNA (uracil(1939)-C(5))-methyltransferase RlmD [Petrocella atlantisensis]VDN47337.1 putative enzyme [Petrocella atlantisensis]